MKRKIIFLHYLLQQEKSSMVYKVLQATQNNPVKNDFVQTCTKYLKQLDIDMSFDLLEKMSEWKLKRLVRTKTAQTGFKYLKEKISGQTLHTLDMTSCVCKNICWMEMLIRKCLS